MTRLNFIVLTIILSLIDPKVTAAAELRYRIRKAIEYHKPASSNTGGESSSGSSGGEASNHFPFFISDPILDASEYGPYNYFIETDDEDPDDLLTISAIIKPDWMNFIDYGNRTATLFGSLARINTSPSFITSPPGDFTTIGDGAYITYDYAVEDQDMIDTANVSAPTMPAFMALRYDGTRTGTGTISGVTPPVAPEHENNTAPYFTTSTPSAFEAAGTGAYISYNFSVTDENTVDSVTSTSVVLPMWLAFRFDGLRTGTGQIAGVTPPEISIEDTHEPLFASTPVTAGQVGSSYTYNFSVTDQNTIDSVLVSGSVLPAWLTISYNGNRLRTGSLSGTPPSSGDYDVIIQAIDASGASTDQSYTIHVP